jgi:chemotaxis methyl-accepting protein methylase/PAS domain-containing protein
MAEPSNPRRNKPRQAQSGPAAAANGGKARAVGDDFPIVGIGCSAGGLEALERFFGKVPENCGIAFVVIQHLDPHRPSMLPELLGRASRLPVGEARNRTRVKPGHVYVTPPDRELSLLHGTLLLLEPTPSQPLRLPIDFFFRTLAEDLQDRSIGVILSGMGSDGLLGLRSIKDRGGLTLAQDPSEARSPSMPQSAIEAGLVDVVDCAQELPARIAAFLNQPQRHLPRELQVAPATQSALAKIIVLLRDRCGCDFSEYKISTLYRRIERRTALHQLGGIAAYVGYLRENPKELDLLFKELLIGVTSFFRDPGVWDYLRDQALPKLFKHYGAGAALRAWVPACSSGEEAYSLAIVFKEALERADPGGRYSLQIYATDIDQDAIDRARRGHFPENISSDVTAERLKRFFVADENGGYIIGKDIRDMVVFAPQNIIADPPFTKLDILSCRNLLIYFGANLQRKLLPLFHYALNRDGLLVLGSAETVGNFNELFEPLDGKSRIFRRMEQATPVTRLDFPARGPVEAAPGGPAEPASLRDTLEYLTDQMVQQNFAPPAVLVNGDGDILYFSGRTGKYLEPAAGKVNVNIHAMAREGLREALTGAIRNAQRHPEPIRLNGLRVGSNGGTQVVDVIIQGLTEPELLRGRVLVVFRDVPAVPRRGGRRKLGETPDVLEAELSQTREALRVAHEEMQTSVEEYKSANEELQSTNEELTTSKEELQSLNEELQTVNAELQSKVDELSGVRNDMTNLLNSIEIATIFLDSTLKLRRFTSHATFLFKLIPGDIGRPLTDVASVLNYPALRDDAQEVLRSLVFCEKQVGSHDGRWFRVRIMPYRTLENLIDGVVITFIDISDIRKVEQELQATRARLAQETAALARLRELSVLLWQVPDLQPGLDALLEALLTSLEAPRGNLQLLSGDTESLHIVAQRGFEQDFLDFFREVSAGHDTACGRALRNGERVVIEDVDLDVAFASYREIARQAGFRSVVSVPLRGTGGTAVGMLSAHFAEPRRFADSELQLIDSFARLAAAFIERIRREK